MPIPGSPTSSMPPEDSFFELIAETLNNLERGARGQFLQQFFKSMAQLDVTETAALEHWERILDRRRELTNRLEKPVSLKTAMMDVLASLSYFRVPILMEYEELKRLQISAATDPLTGLYNRRLFQEQFDKELNRARRYNEHLALVMMDLHEFKQVNDRFGHPRGDQLLQTAAATAQKSLRASDYAFRIGGDEFALLLVQSDTEQATTLGRRLRTNFLAAIQPMQLADTPLGLDYGVAVFPVDGDRREALIRVADERLYAMKNMHRNGAAPLPEPEGKAPSSRPIFEVQDVAPRLPNPSPPEQPVRTERHVRQTPMERRRWERMSLVGTRAYAQIVQPEGNARALDLSYGGVALEISEVLPVAQTFSAILNVPIFRPVRVTLKTLYQVPNGRGQVRLGCAFVS